MAKLHLSITTPQKQMYDGLADSVIVRTASGDVGILPGHIDYAASLGGGWAKFSLDGETREARIGGGLICVSGGEVCVLTNDFAWNAPNG